MAISGISSRHWNFLELLPGQRLSTTRASLPATVGTVGNCLFVFAPFVNFPTLRRTSRRVGIFFISPGTGFPFFVLVATLDSDRISDSQRLRLSKENTRWTAHCLKLSCPRLGISSLEENCQVSALRHSMQSPGQLHSSRVPVLFSFPAICGSLSLLHRPVFGRRIAQLRNRA